MPVVNFAKQKFVSTFLFIISKIIDRKPQPGCHVIFTTDTTLIISPDGFNVALNHQAAADLSQKLSPQNKPQEIVKASL
ncbi:MAG TPA: hypothetical protein DIW23_05740 [Anaerolineae bacterium]|nr:hypothetical protein [Anaerolineae bacterium]